MDVIRNMCHTCIQLHLFSNQEILFEMYHSKSIAQNQDTDLNSTKLLCFRRIRKFFYSASLCLVHLFTSENKSVTGLEGQRKGLVIDANITVSDFSDIILIVLLPPECFLTPSEVLFRKTRVQRKHFSFLIAYEYCLCCSIHLDIFVSD